MHNSEPIGAKAGLTALRPASAIAMVIAACSVFEPPIAGAPDASAGSGGTRGGSAGASGASSQSGSNGNGGSAGSSGTTGSGGSSGTSGSGGSSGGDAGGEASAGTGGALPVGPWWRHTNPDGCETEGVPSSADRPSVPDGPSLAPITLATSRIRIGGVKDDITLTVDTSAWRTIGFDFDRSCTLSPTCLSGDAPLDDRACAPANPLVDVSDGDSCRDNVLGKLFPIGASSTSVGGWFGVNEASWNCAIHRGETTNIWRITNYNGTPYDPSVRLDLYGSIGTRLLPVWTCLKPDNTIDPAWPSQAPWQATRHWYISRRSIALNAPDSGNELPIARFADPAAFVRGGYLFAALPPGAEVWFMSQRAHVRPLRTVLQRAIVVGKLERDGTTWVLDDATVQGAVLPSDELQSFREIGFCENMCDSYQVLKGYFNNAQDALSSTSDKLPATTCDALSIGFSFKARSATADITDLIDTDPPVDCPQPLHPAAPRHGCVCQSTGTCAAADADSGAPADASADSAAPADAGGG